MSASAQNIQDLLHLYQCKSKAITGAEFTIGEPWEQSDGFFAELDGVNEIPSDNKAFHSKKQNQLPDGIPRSHA